MGCPWQGANPVTSAGALLLRQTRASSEPSTSRAMTSRTSYAVRQVGGHLGRTARLWSTPWGSRPGRGPCPWGGDGQGLDDVPQRPHGPRGFAMGSATPEVRACSSPPPRSSPATTSPVAAFTSGGPARKIVPCRPHDHGLVAHRRHVGAARGARAHDARDLRDPPRGHPGLVEEDPAKVVAVREHLVLHRQEGAAESRGEAGQPVLERDLLAAVLLTVSRK